MTNVKTLTGLTASSNTAGNWTPTQGIRTSVLDATNQRFLRSVRLDNQGITVSRPGLVVAIPMSALFALVATHEANLSWAPVVTVQPSNVNIAAPAATNFAITATSELNISYQWQKSTDNGGNWANVVAAGVYSNVTTNHLNISNTTGLTGLYVRCTAINTSGSNNSNAGVLTVT